jgi:opacity protein-like surface antigen
MYIALTQNKIPHRAVVGNCTTSVARRKRTIYMKRSFAQMGAIALMLMPTVVRADGGANRHHQFSIGAQAGLSLARFAGPRANDEFVSSFYGVGATLGAALELRLTDIVAVQTEVMFTLKRSHSTLDGMDAATYHMKYFEVPLLARISLPISRRVECYGILGPVVSILLDADAYFADIGHVDLERGFKRIDIGLALGAGAIMPVRTMHAISFEIRYNHGLRDIDDTIADDELMKRAIYFTVGYRANLDDLLHGF